MTTESMENKVTWYTLLIFFGFLVALIAMFGLANMFGANSNTTINSQATASTKPQTASSSARVVETNPLTIKAIAEVKMLTQAKEVDIEVVRQESVQWPDTSLGCPVRGFTYAQVIVPGYTITLRVEDELFEYHTDLNKEVVLCKSKKIDEQ